MQGLGATETSQVVKAVNQLSQDPTYDALRLHPVKGDRTGRKYTCRASRDIRILLLKQGPLLLLDRAGHHDDMYDLAARIDLVFNQGTGRIVVTDRAETTASDGLHSDTSSRRHGGRHSTIVADVSVTSSS